MAKKERLDVLEQTIGKYVKHLDAKSLNVAVWSGPPYRKPKTDDDEESRSKKISRDSLAHLLELSRKEWKWIALSALTLEVTSSVTLLLPYASGTVIDYTINSGNDGLSPVVLAVGLFGLSALAGGGVYLQSLWLARAGNRIVARLRQQLYASMLQQEAAFSMIIKRLREICSLD
jgi:ABC-type bacteriocin/lantibiotic exporter with double-glycine peptidase domain